MVRQPADAEQHRHDDDHLGDLALGPLGLGHAVQGVHGGPQVLDGPGVGQAHDQHGDDVAEHEGACVQDFAVVGLPAGDADGAVVVVDEVIVAEVGAGEHQGQTPDDHHGDHSVAGGPQLSGAQGVSDGQVPRRERKMTRGGG